MSHPSVIKDGATYVMYYTGDSSGDAEHRPRDLGDGERLLHRAKAQVLTPGAAGRSTPPA